MDLNWLTGKKKSETDTKDIELIPTGDWHIGSTMAIHPPAGLIPFYYPNNPQFIPSSLQDRLWKHFEKCTDEIAERRKGKSLFILKMGDEIDGDHHNTFQLVTREITEQTNTAVEVMKYFEKRLDYQRGDTLACLRGTFVHVGKQEDEIGRQLGAHEYEVGVYASSFVELNLKGNLIWAYHKGVSAGQGQTRGNSCVYKLRQIYYQCLQSGSPIPDMVISAHTHDAHYSTWTRPDGKVMHYLITAPFQDKTQFAQDNLATNKNAVGMQSITITDGGIIVNEKMLMQSPLGHSVVIK